MLAWIVSGTIVGVDGDTFRDAKQFKWRLVGQDLVTKPKFLGGRKPITLAQFIARRGRSYSELRAATITYLDGNRSNLTRENLRIDGAPIEPSNGSSSISDRPSSNAACASEPTVPARPWFSAKAHASWLNLGFIQREL